MIYVVRVFGPSLKYGNEHIYQAMPRLLSLAGLWQHIDRCREERSWERRTQTTDSIYNAQLHQLKCPATVPGTCTLPVLHCVSTTHLTGKGTATHRQTVADHHRITPGAVPPTGLVDDDGCHQIFISNENKKRSRYLRCGHQETTKLEQIHSGLQRKITMIGSDGKHYVMMCKPKDDLRKDCSLMEFNAIINKIL